MAQSFVRIGSFQIHASRREEDLEIVRTLADYVIRHYFQQFKNLPTELQTASEDIKLLPEKNKYLGIVILLPLHQSDNVLHFLECFHIVSYSFVTFFCL